MFTHICKTLFFILWFGIIFYGCNDNTQKQHITQNTPIDTPTPHPPPQKSELTLIMAGDALLHKAVYEDAKRIIPNASDTTTSKKEVTYVFCHMFKDIAPIIKQHDLAFYNQETILGGKEIGLSSYPSFNSPQEFGDCMMQIGFNLISLANNHTLDRGEKAIMRSLQYWQHQPALASGSYQSLQERNTPKIYKKNNITYTLLAYTYGTNGIPVPKGKEYLVNVYTKEMIKEDIARVRKNVDLLLVSMHWGDEYVFMPNKQQQDFAKFLANQGVDIVIGTHPHVIQPIEWINNTLVFYSLGNMISAQEGLSRKIGLLGGIKVIKDLSTNTINLADLRVELFYTHHDSKKRNFHLYPFRLLDEKILPNHEQIYKEYIQILQKKQPDISFSIFKY